MVVIALLRKYIYEHTDYVCLCIYMTQAGSTALMSHCTFGTVESLRLLIDRGADVNYRDAVITPNYHYYIS